jgi:hypothetical protein
MCTIQIGHSVTRPLDRPVIEYPTCATILKAENDLITGLHTRFKTAKAWAANARAHLGRKEPKTSHFVHLDQTAAR